MTAVAFFMLLMVDFTASENFNSDVEIFNKHSFAQVQRADRMWAVLFCNYRESSCKRLAKEWDSVGEALEGQAYVGFADVRKQPEIKESEKIGSKPTIKLYKRSEFNRASIETKIYRGQQRAKDIIKFVDENIPEYTIHASHSNYHSHGFPQVVVFDNEQHPSLITKSLSYELRNNMKVILVNMKDRKLVKQFGVNTNNPSYYFVWDDISKPLIFHGTNVFKDVYQWVTRLKTMGPNKRRKKKQKVKDEL